jgi:hypothetical protein
MDGSKSFWQLARFAVVPLRVWHLKSGSGVILPWISEVAVILVCWPLIAAIMILYVMWKWHFDQFEWRLRHRSCEGFILRCYVLINEWIIVLWFNSCQSPDIFHNLTWQTTLHSALWRSLLIYSLIYESWSLEDQNIQRDFQWWNGTHFFITKHFLTNRDNI